jgi:amino-acid N-acetyltransferase
MKPTDLRGILQYIPRFREKVFILAIDGAIVTDENFANLLLDIAVLRSLNIRVVIVHGASAQIKSLGEGQGFKPTDLFGTGITSPPAIFVPSRPTGSSPIPWGLSRVWTICLPARWNGSMSSCSRT